MRKETLEQLRERQEAEKEALAAKQRQEYIDFRDYHTWYSEDDFLHRQVMERTEMIQRHEAEEAALDS